MLKTNSLLKKWFITAVALLMSTQVLAEESSIDRTQPYQMTQVAGVF
ncbi:hypothetical protein O9992_06870 [Vibrio lentus]|nr:hypothetical protein [Vibrio lentus]